MEKIQGWCNIILILLVCQKSGSCILEEFLAGQMVLEIPIERDLQL